MGRNGAGKTTVLRALMGVLPKTGSVQLDGLDITAWSGHRINAAGMVWVPQDHSVFPGLTVREHLVIAVGGRGGEAAIAAGGRALPDPRGAAGPGGADPLGR